MCALYFKTHIHQMFKLSILPRLFIRKLHKHLSSEKLTNRKVIRISGENSNDFLQGLITNDMNNLINGSNSLYTLFLNNKGRVLYDAIIFRTNEKNTFFLDCDSECTQELIKHLKLYKLRRKVDIAPIDSEYSVWAIYDTNVVDKLQNAPSSSEIKLDFNLDIESIASKKDIMVVDPRLSALGYRAIIQSDDKINKIPANDKYKMCRHKLGIGEGLSELKVGLCFPLELNCDYINGVSFDKGCYIGQELTARTYHTGVVRKRLMPLVFDCQPKDIPHDTHIDDPTVSRKTPIGKLKGYSGHFGIGLMRISEALESKSLKVLDFNVRASIPYWWPNSSVNFKNVIINK